MAARRVSDRLHEPRVILLGHLELERGSLEHPNGVILATGNNPERPSRSKITRVDRFRLTGDLPDRGTGIGHEHMPEPLPSLTNDHNPLAVR